MHISRLGYHTLPYIGTEVTDDIHKGTWKHTVVYLLCVYSYIRSLAIEMSSKWYREPYVQITMRNGLGVSYLNRAYRM